MEYKSTSPGATPVSKQQQPINIEEELDKNRLGND
jgi:hypothetical protein